jgi:alpha-D-ribose 1-methylphosphonate 5-triphosphate synthase subunit PhnI
VDFQADLVMVRSMREEIMNKTKAEAEEAA